MFGKTRTTVHALALVLLSTVCSGHAFGLLFTGTSGSLAASAAFALVAGNLQVTLTTTSMPAVLVPSDLLTGVFFTLAGDPALTSLSAVLTAGSTVFFGGTDPGNVVGGEWAYASGLNGAPRARTKALAVPD